MEEEIIVIETEEETELVIIEDEVQYIEPATQEITVNPSFEDIVKTPDEGFTGFSKVTVKSIPDEYIIPSGEIDIIENGSYDITQKAVANVNVPEKILGTKTINKNGIYNALDDGIDGYSSVEVVTSGVDINDYFFNSTSGTAKDLVKKLPNLEISGTSMSAFANGFSKLEYFPDIDTSNVTTMYQMCYGCQSLKEIPLLNTSNVTDISYMFYNCKSLKEIPLFDTSKVTKVNSFAYGCSSLEEFPELDLSQVTSSVYYLFRGCTSLKRVANLNTHKAPTFQDTFYGCTSLEEIGTIEAESVTQLSTNIFNNCSNLVTFGGFNNLGEAYLTTASANYSNYKLFMSNCNNLSEQSIINILTKLYDIKTKGCNTQQVVLGSTNLAKLTSEEGQQALTDAQAKGWTVS